MAYNPNMYLAGPQTPFAGQYQPWGYQPLQNAQQPVNGLVSVTGIEGAKAYQLPPNSSMPLFDKDSDILYVKTTDGAGFPTVKAFRFEPMEAEQQASGYVGREEFEELAAKVEGLSSKPRARKAADGE